MSGFVQSGRFSTDLLRSGVAWWDAADGSAAGQSLVNRGSGGSALNAQLGSTTGADTNDPLWLPRSPTGTNYAYLPGVADNRLWHVAPAQLPGATAFDFRIALALSDFTPATTNVLATQGTGGALEPFRIYLNGANATIELSDGAALQSATTANVTQGLTDDSPAILRVTWAAPSTTTWYRKVTTEATAIADMASNSGWTALASVPLSAPVASIATSALALSVGGQGGGLPCLGKLYGYQVSTTIDGSPFLSADLTTLITTGDASTLTASTGQTITVSRSTSGRKLALVTRPIYLFGTNDYMEVADSDLLDFGASDSFTAWVLVRQWATPVSNGRYMNKRASTGAGWLLQASGTAQQGLFYFESTGAVQNITAATSAGDLRLYAGIRDAVADTIGSALNGTITTPTTDTTTGSLANASTLRIGCRSDSVNNVQDFEFLAAGVFRRALTAADLTTIVNFYGAA